MLSWCARGEGFQVELADGSSIHAATLVLTLGPWFRDALETLGVPTRVHTHVQAWFTPATDAYAATKFPGFLVDRPELPAPLYGFPDFGDGVKAAFHGGGVLTTADTVDREIDHVRDIAPLKTAMDDWMPGAADAFRSAKACLYTLTPDEHFVVDCHPEHPRLILCGGFSGHGFKFAPVIGEIAADLALAGGTAHPIGFLSCSENSDTPGGFRMRTLGTCTAIPQNRTPVSAPETSSSRTASARCTKRARSRGAPQLIVNVYFLGRARQQRVVAGRRGTGLLYAPICASGEAFRPRAHSRKHSDHARAFRPRRSAAALARHWGVDIFAHPLELPYLTGRSSYPPPDPTVGGGRMAWSAMLYPKSRSRFAVRKAVA
jgi:hypothetical protein